MGPRHHPAAGPPAWAATTCAARHNRVMAVWQYARLEYRSTGKLGTDRFMDWSATFHHPGGVERWGTDERFNDLKHLNRAGAAGWQVYDRGVITVPNEPHRLYAVTYSMRRMVS